jgi:hypothetical protein
MALARVFSQTLNETLALVKPSFTETDIFFQVNNTVLVTYPKTNKPPSEIKITFPSTGNGAALNTTTVQLPSSGAQHESASYENILNLVDPRFNESAVFNMTSYLVTILSHPEFKPSNLSILYPVNSTSSVVPPTYPNSTVAASSKSPSPTASPVVTNEGLNSTTPNVTVSSSSATTKTFKTSTLVIFPSSRAAASPYYTSAITEPLIPNQHRLEVRADPVPVVPTAAATQTPSPEITITLDEWTKLLEDKASALRKETVAWVVVALLLIGSLSTAGFVIYRKVFGGFRKAKSESHGGSFVGLPNISRPVPLHHPVL